MIHTYLVCNPFVFSWKKSENTKMAAVITDVFRHLVKSLSEVNNAAVFVPPVDKIINDARFGFFRKQDHQKQLFFGCPPEALRVE